MKDAFLDNKDMNYPYYCPSVRRLVRCPQVTIKYLVYPSAKKKEKIEIIEEKVEKS